MSIAEEAPPPRSNVIVDRSITTFIANEKGQASNHYAMDVMSKGARDVIFMHSVPDDFPAYKSWVLEITDASDTNRFLLSLDGKLPKVLHWDGFFGGGDPIRVGRRYFMRLLMVFEDAGQFVSSPWAYFDTVEKKESAERLNNWETIDLYVAPSAAGYLGILKTKTQKFMTFPCLYADVRAIYDDKHTLAMRFETISNTLFTYTTSGFFYSDFSLFYLYRLRGAPLRAPVFPVVPPYMENKVKLQVGEETYGKRENWEVGIRLFYTVLRTTLANPTDIELVRAANGLSLITHYDRSVYSFRAMFDGELGYSLFAGRVLTAAAGFTLAYDRFRTVLPGLQFRYQIYLGKPPADEYNASQSIVNHLIQIGGVLSFKL